MIHLAPRYFNGSESARVLCGAAYHPRPFFSFAHGLLYTPRWEQVRWTARFGKATCEACLDTAVALLAGGVLTKHGTRGFAHWSKSASFGGVGQAPAIYFVRYARSAGPLEPFEALVGEANLPVAVEQASVQLDQWGDILEFTDVTVIR